MKIWSRSPCGDRFHQSEGVSVCWVWVRVGCYRTRLDGGGEGKLERLK